MVRRFGRKGEERIEGWKISKNEGFIIYRICFSPNIIIRMTKSRKVRWVGI
jgi:hypothetical protein